MQVYKLQALKECAVSEFRKKELVVTDCFKLLLICFEPGQSVPPCVMERSGNYRFNHLIPALIGKGSGLKGKLISFFMGTIPTSPLYMAFPLAGSILHKGARTSNIVIFMGSWAAIKVPQLIAEPQFLGPSYTALRFILTLMAVIVIGNIMVNIITIEDLPNNED